jgi:hypothetical protein
MEPTTVWLIGEADGRAGSVGAHDPGVIMLGPVAGEADVGSPGGGGWPSGGGEAVCCGRGVRQKECMGSASCTVYSG